MTAQVDTDEIRQIEAEAAPSRFARGWHCLGLTRDLGDGKPHAIHAFNQKLVVFRSGDGRINVLDGYCRHMGGDLTQGEVKGDEIACPFHDWRWGGDGRCKSVPYARRVPRLARTATWTTLEQDGMFFVWNDPEHNPPPPEVTIPRIEGATTRPQRLPLPTPRECRRTLLPAPEGQDRRPFGASGRCMTEKHRQL